MAHACRLWVSTACCVESIHEPGRRAPDMQCEVLPPFTRGCGFISRPPIGGGSRLSSWGRGELLENVRSDRAGRLRTRKGMQQLKQCAISPVDDFHRMETAGTISPRTF